MKAHYEMFSAYNRWANRRLYDRAALLADEDYRWVTETLMDVAARHAGGRVVSTLEGGYNVEALGRCVVEHVSALQRD